MRIRIYASWSIPEYAGMELNFHETRVLRGRLSRRARWFGGSPRTLNTTGNIAIHGRVDLDKAVSNVA